MKTAGLKTALAATSRRARACYATVIFSAMPLAL